MHFQVDQYPKDPDSLVQMYQIGNPNIKFGANYIFTKEKKFTYEINTDGYINVNRM